MPFTLICLDHPGALELRQATREAHLAYVRETGAVEQAGPFLDPDGQMIGSLVILNVDTEEAAALWAANDPYAQAGLFQSVQVMHWNRVIG